MALFMRKSKKILPSLISNLWIFDFGIILTFECKFDIMHVVITMSQIS